MMFLKQILKSNIEIVALALLTSLNACMTEVYDQAKIDLSGEWSVRLDTQNIGLERGWYDQLFEDKVTLPGCLQAQGYGEQPGPNTKWWANLDLSQRHPSLKKYSQADSNFKLIQYLMPRHHFIGAAWYNRQITIPKSYEGKNLILKLERCHWESQVWLDGVRIGTNQSLATAHEYELGDLSSGEHMLSIRIDNGEIYKIGKMAHSVSDQTQGTWNGIVGEISIVAKPYLRIADTQVYPDINSKTVKVKTKIINPKRVKVNYVLSLSASGYNGHNHVPKASDYAGKLNGDSIQVIELNYVLGKGTALWDEFNPNLYRLMVSFESGESIDTDTVTFGMREITTDASNFYVNGIKTFMRGNVDCALNPRTGYVPLSVDRWKEILQQHKNFGLNLVRFHSWCPPKQAFIAADELGVYLAPEVHEWSSVKEGPVVRFFKNESREMLDYFGNYASFCMMGLGNESRIEEPIAKDLIDKWKKLDTRHLYTVKISVARNAGSPKGMDFEVLGHIKDPSFDRGRLRIRYQAFWPPLPENSLLCTDAPQTTLDWREGVSFYKEKFGRPVITHELAQFCAYPDLFNEMKKYTGYLRPTYLEVAADQLRERGMIDQLDDFVYNSGRWQVMLTREEIEATFRTPELGGFQWLSLNDFTGQSTAPVGFTDAFYEPKSYVDADEMKKFCGPDVLLARLSKRVYTPLDTLNARLEISHFSKAELDLNDLEVYVADEKGQKIKTVRLQAKINNHGNAQPLGTLILPLSALPAPAKYTLTMKSTDNNLLSDWEFWVFPDDNHDTTLPEDIKIAHLWNSETYELLQSGEKVLLLPEIGTLKGNLPPCFTTYYWTSFGERGGQSSACGIMMNPEHALFNAFPTSSHADWKWWDILSQCQPMILDEFEEKHPWPKAYRPLIQPIDTWKLNRKLGLVIEAKVNKGKLLICSIDLINELDKRPATRQLRKSVIQYMSSDDFDPQVEVKINSISSLFDQSKPEIKVSLQGLPTDVLQ